MPPVVIFRLKLGGAGEEESHDHQANPEAAQQCRGDQNFGHFPHQEIQALRTRQHGEEDQEPRAHQVKIQGNAV